MEELIRLLKKYEKKNMRGCRPYRMIIYYLKQEYNYDYLKENEKNHK